MARMEARSKIGWARPSKHRVAPVQVVKAGAAEGALQHLLFVVVSIALRPGIVIGLVPDAEIGKQGLGAGTGSRDYLETAGAGVATTLLRTRSNAFARAVLEICGRRSDRSTARESPSKEAAINRLRISAISPTPSGGAR